jgi:hypothetical protein
MSSTVWTGLALFGAETLEIRYRGPSGNESRVMVNSECLARLASEAYRLSIAQRQARARTLSPSGDAEFLPPHRPAVSDVGSAPGAEEPLVLIRLDEGEREIVIGWDRETARRLAAEMIEECERLDAEERGATH